MRFVLLIFYLLHHACLFAQEAEPLGSSYAREQEASQSEGGNSEDDFLWQQSEYFRNHPIDINTVPEETLNAFPFLSPLQVQHFLDYRKLMGPFINIYELQAIPAWDIETITKIKPYVMVRNDNESLFSWRGQLRKSQRTLLFRIGRTIEQAKGFGVGDSAGIYEGGPIKMLIRYKQQYKNLLQFGITAEKDPGERIFTQSQKTGFDFYSFHFFKRGKRILKILAIGDYYISMGQGLIHWQSFAFKKGTETLNIKRQAPVIRPYNSTDENRFHRGIAVGLAKKSFSLDLFVAYDKLDANYAFDTISRFGYVTAFQNTGYHRTPEELKDKDVLNMFSAGSVLKWRYRGLILGLNSTLYRLNLPLKKSEEPYNLTAISGKKWGNYSLDFSYTFRNIHGFGDLAFDKNFKRGIVLGALFSLHPRVDCAILYRNIDSYYRSLYGNSFTVNSEPNNEKGLYVGISLKVSSSWKLNFYCDSYRFPWLKFRVNKPGWGMDYLLTSQYVRGKNLTIESTFAYTSRSSNSAATIDSVIAAVSENPLWKFRNSIYYKFNQSIILQTRLDVVGFGEESTGQENGFSTLVDVFYKPARKKYALNARFQYFETDGYNSRVYTFENDVMYYFSIPALSNAGIRYYLNFRVDIYKNISIWVKWAQTHYNKADGIGSGQQQIDGSHKSDLRFQTCVVF